MGTRHYEIWIIDSTMCTSVRCDLGHRTQCVSRLHAIRKRWNPSHVWYTQQWKGWGSNIKFSWGEFRLMAKLTLTIYSYDFYVKTFKMLLLGDSWLTQSLGYHNGEKILSSWGLCVQFLNGRSSRGLWVQFWNEWMNGATSAVSKQSKESGADPELKRRPVVSHLGIEPKRMSHASDAR